MTPSINIVFDSVLVASGLLNKYSLTLEDVTKLMKASRVIQILLLALPLNIWVLFPGDA